jgi:hypothetical protein
MNRGRTYQILGIIFGQLLIIYLVLAVAQADSGNSCGWKFPKWFGCVLSIHENLAAGLFGAAGALVAAWIAWSAVQQQINADRERMMADRVEAEKLLADDMTDYAAGMAAAWRLLAPPLGLVERPKSEQAVREAAAYMADRLSRPERIANYRGMAETLGWDRRSRYNSLINGLEELRRFKDSSAIADTDQILDVIRNLSYEFEWCLPSTSEYFTGLWRRTPKAMSFADYIEYIGGMNM